MRKLVLLLAIMSFSQVLFAENFLVNGDWETGDITGWAARFGSGVVTAVSENPTPRSGIYCGKQTGRTQSWHGTIQSQNLLDVLERGQTYTFSAWVMTSTDTPVDVALSVQSNPNDEARYTNLQTLQADNTAWVQMYGLYTFPTEEEDNGTEYTFYFDIPGSATAELYIDDVFLSTSGPVNSPYNPYVEPYIGAADVVGSPSTTDGVNYTIDDIVLSFNAGRNPETGDGVDPFIASHYVFLSKDLPDDPNLYLIATLPQNSTTDPFQSLALADVLPDPIKLKPDTTYSWQVLQIMKDIDGNEYDYNDPNNILGDVWTFTTTSPVPVITSITDHMLIDENGNASYTITTSPSGNYFRWFKVVGEVDSIDNGENNDIMLTDTGIYSGTTTKTLSITGAAMDGSDDAKLYAIAYNGDPDLSTTTYSLASPTRWLWAPKLKSHFTFDTLAGGVTYDIAGGLIANVYSDNPRVNPARLAYGLPELGGRSLTFGGNTGSSNSGNYAVMTPGAVDYKDITISVWVFWKGGSSWQRIIDCGTGTDNYIFITPNDGSSCVFAVKYAGSEAKVSTSRLPEDTWTQVTATLNGDTARLYINGEFAASGSVPYNPVDFASTNNYLAKSQWTHDSYFNGVIDDLKIYNYARSTMEIAQDYLALKGGWVCDREILDLPYDFNDDCIIDVLDLADFASEWMSSARFYPGQN